MRHFRSKYKINVGLKFYVLHFSCCTKLKILLSIDPTCCRLVVSDFERDDHIAPDLRALNWLSVANRRCSLQTPALASLFIILPLFKRILYLCCRTILHQSATEKAHTNSIYHLTSQHKAIINFSLFFF